MFAQGLHPAVIIIGDEKFADFTELIERIGYRRHDGLRVTRENELAAWVRRFGLNRQIHVQVSTDSTGTEFHVFAHTEPAGYGLDHLLSALNDMHDFDEGARILRYDLRNARRRRGRAG